MTLCGQQGSPQRQTNKLWLDIKVRLLTLSLQGTQAAQGWIRGGYKHIYTQARTDIEINNESTVHQLPHKMQIVKRELENENDREKKQEEMSTMNNFNSKL